MKKIMILSFGFIMSVASVDVNAMFRALRQITPKTGTQIGKRYFSTKFDPQTTELHHNSTKGIQDLETAKEKLASQKDLAQELINHSLQSRRNNLKAIEELPFWKRLLGFASPGSEIGQELTRNEMAYLSNSLWKLHADNSLSCFEEALKTVEKDITAKDNAILYRDDRIKELEEELKRFRNANQIVKE